MLDKKTPTQPRVHDPDYWRSRAESARKQAAVMKDEKAKNVMLNIAEQHERFARVTEERLRPSSE